MVEDVINLISNTGFPIACCCGLFWFSNKLVDKITTVISDNTLAIQKLSEKMGGEEGEH